MLANCTHKINRNGERLPRIFVPLHTKFVDTKPPAGQRERVVAERKGSRKESCSYLPPLKRVE